MDDLLPTEDKIEWALKRQKNHCSGGPSGMRAYHLKGWLAAKKRKEKEEAAAKKENLMEERTAEGPDSTGGEETEDSMGDTTT